MDGKLLAAGIFMLVILVALLIARPSR